MPQNALICKIFLVFKKKTGEKKKEKDNENNFWFQVIGGYYLDAVEELGGCPRSIRSDCGTENVLVQDIQVYLRNKYNNSHYPGFLVGRSPANQRIESWWCILRKHSAQFWMNLFQNLCEDGYYDGSFLDRSLIQFCFMDIIQVGL